MKARVRAVWLILAAAAAAAACRGTVGEVMASLKVRRGTFQVAIPAFGELQAAKSTPIVVPTERQFGSQTIGWLAPEFSFVKKDEVVVRLASTELDQLLRTEEAALAKIELEIFTKKGSLPFSVGG